MKNQRVSGGDNFCLDGATRAWYYDQATQLQWNQNRWYNPSIQRWMGPDSIRPGPGRQPLPLLRQWADERDRPERAGWP